MKFKAGPTLRNIRQLEVFLEVADRLSFSRAAERLFLTQPAVSRYIKELEQNIGLPLFDHRKRNLALTDAGHTLQQHARQVIAQIEAMEAALQPSSGDLSGSVRLSSGVAWEVLLSEVLVDFQRLHPQVNLRIRILGTPQMTELLLDNRLAFGFGPDEPRDTRLEGQHIADFEMAVIAPPDHRLAHHAQVSPKQLENEPFVAYSAAESAPSYRYLLQLGVKPNYVMETESFEGIKRAVESGIGISLMMKYMARGELASGRLAQLRISAPPSSIALRVITNRSRTLTPAEQAVLDHVRAKAVAIANAE